MDDITMADVPNDSMILPGEILSTVFHPVKLGPGLQLNAGNAGEPTIQATQAGLVHKTKLSEFYVDYISHRYIPSQGESVIGQILAKTADFYRVDINSARPATLSTLSFEAATKQNRPMLNTTQLVYSCVATANKDIDPEIECVAPASGKAAGFGELKGGLLVDGLSMAWCRKLMTEEEGALTELGKYIGFQCAVGMNGRVWVDAGDILNTIIAARVIREGEGMLADELQSFIRRLLVKS